MKGFIHKIDLWKLLHCFLSLMGNLLFLLGLSVDRLHGLPQVLVQDLQQIVSLEKLTMVTVTCRHQHGVPY